MKMMSLSISLILLLIHTALSAVRPMQNWEFLQPMQWHHKRAPLKPKVSKATSIDCIHMDSAPGDYIYKSTGDYGDTVCGFYIIGHSDELIELEFNYFDVSCSNGGLLTVVDGWELNGQFFPSADDHQLPVHNRYEAFCNSQKTPKKRVVYASSQNVAMLQFRMPKAGNWFQVSVRFVRNSQPCNILSMSDHGTYTLKNYGKAVNCSYSIIFPEAMHLLALDVGETAEGTFTSKETGTITKCETRGRSDYVEFLDGNGLSPSSLVKVSDACGLSSKAGLIGEILGCQNSVIRLVSSGEYFNTVTFSYRPLKEAELQCDMPEEK